VFVQTGNCSTVELPGALSAPGRDSNPHPVAWEAITGMLRPAASPLTSRSWCAIRMAASNRRVFRPLLQRYPDCSGPRRVDTWELHPRRPPHRSPVLPHRPGVHVLTSCYGPMCPAFERRGKRMRRQETLWGGSRRAAPAVESGIPHLRLDHRVACDQRGRDAVATVPDVEAAAGTRQTHRPCLAALSSHARYSSIFGRSRPRPRRRMSASGTHVVVSDAASGTRLPSRGRKQTASRPDALLSVHGRRG
jgi:hypothetical protein